MDFLFSGMKYVKALTNFRIMNDILILFYQIVTVVLQ